MKKSRLADEYMQLKATQADLAEQEERLKKQLLALGDTEIEGKLARVTISEVAGRLSYDSALLKKLVPASTLVQCEKQGKSFIRFGVKSRTAA